MPDTAAVITRAISEHHAIREHVKLAEDTVKILKPYLLSKERTPACSNC